MKELEQFDEVLCRINIRPEYKGRKANEKVTSAYNGKVLLMKAMWQMEEDGKYPNEWAMVPAIKEDWYEMINYTGWIASGDMEEIDCATHEKE